MEIEVANLAQNKILFRKGDAVILDLKLVREYDLEIAELISQEPRKFIEEVKRRFELQKVHLLNFDEYEMDIGNLRVSHIGKLVTIKGMIAQATKPLALLKSRNWECDFCGVNYSTSGDKPNKCSCQSQKFTEVSMELEDIQEIEIEESQETIEGRQPERVRIRLPKELTSKDFMGLVQPGNKVIVVGIVEKIPAKKNKQLEEELFEYRIHALDLATREESFEDDLVTEKEKEEMEEIANNNPLEKLQKSLAPSIHGHEEVKKAIVLQMVGGVKKKKSNGTPTRDRIHLLLIGDPGTSKTQLGKNAHLRTPRSYYLSGESASKAGLTATVEQDVLLGTWGLRAGAICKCNGSVLILDEIDKLDKEDRKALHTPMEAGEVVVNKATVHTTLKADCSILALANPKMGMFDLTGKKTVVEQIDLPSPLISRFDIVFMMRDQINETMDKEIAEIIYSQKSDELIIPIPLFRKYIAHAKKFKPQLKKEHLNALAEFYHKVRRQSISTSSKMTGMPITPRHLEGIIRMAEAHAKLRFSDEVTKEDLKLAQGLFYESLLKLGMDEEIGVIDMARMGGGQTISTKKKIEVIKEIFKIVGGDGKVVTYKELRHILSEKGLSYEDYEKTLDDLNREGSIIKKVDGWVWI
jgi:replicative DNA helicase Mcm